MRLKRIASWPASSRTAALLLLFFVSADVSAAAAQTDGPAILDVSARYFVHNGRPTVAFKITNVSKSTISIPQSRLPWATRQSVVLVAVDAETGEPLRPIVPIEDSFGPPPIIALSSGKNVRGNLDIARFADNVDNVLTERAIVVFWYYTAIDESGLDLGHFGGWMLAPRKRL